MKVEYFPAPAIAPRKDREREPHARPNRPAPRLTWAHHPENEGALLVLPEAPSLREFDR